MRTVSEYAASCGRRLMALRDGEWARYRHAREIEAGLHRSLDELKTRQLRRLADILDRAYHHTTFYRKRFDEIGFQPGDLKDFADMHKLPPLDKADIRDHMNEMICDDIPPVQLAGSYTGGTTGIPLHFHRDKPGQTYRRALDLVIFRRCGWQEGQWIGWLWGAARDFICPATWKARIAQSWGHRTYYLDIANLTDETYEHFVAQTRRRHPPLLSGYPSLVYDLAQRIEANAVSAIRVPAISLTAEPLYEYQRRKIQKVLADRVFTRYGTREFGMTAFECEQHDGLHVFTDSVYLETVPGEGPDKSYGVLLATDLINRAMPLIRYRTGDLGRLDETPCPCGLALPRLAEIGGREVDLIWRPDGSGISGQVPVTLLGIMNIGTRVQFVQPKVDEFVVRYEQRDGQFTKEINKYIQALRAAMGDCFHYRAEPVMEIRLEASGKYRFVVSQVGKPKKSA